MGSFEELLAPCVDSSFYQLNNNKFGGILVMEVCDGFIGISGGERTRDFSRRV